MDAEQQPCPSEYDGNNPRFAAEKRAGCQIQSRAMKKEAKTKNFFEFFDFALIIHY
jgi:hypothetical protein